MKTVLKDTLPHAMFGEAAGKEGNEWGVVVSFFSFSLTSLLTSAEESHASLLPC